MEIKKQALSFAAIDPYVQQNIILPTEKEQPGKDMVEWGDKNIYPEYINDLAMTVPSLRSIIKGTVDYIVGDDQTIQVPGLAPNQVNKRGDMIADQVRCLATDEKKLGGFALQVIRDLSGKPAEAYYIDLRFLRSNKENTVFYYCEKWSKTGRKDVITYPAYMTITPERWAQLTPEERDRHASSIYYVKNEPSQTYPAPLYCAAVKACEIERNIADFHLNALENDFTSSMIINFNNGIPTDEDKEEIEKEVNEKFSGHQNAGRILLSFNPDKDNATTFSAPEVKDFGQRYDALYKYARQQVFTAFRANPNLFGIPTENLGFSQEEYESAFRLYNRTAVRPVQRLICDTYAKIFGQEVVLTIKPFSLDEGTSSGEQNVN